MTALPVTADADSAMPKTPPLEPLQWFSLGSAVLDATYAQAKTNVARAGSPALPLQPFSYATVVVSALLSLHSSSLIGFVTADTVSLRSLFDMDAIRACEGNDLGAPNSV